jgi:predicted DNA-binding antitoxin AbrB/MazE fold protein
MNNQFEAVYQDGVLKPLEPIPLSERERVRVTISRPGEEDWMDIELMQSCADEADDSVSLAEVRSALSKIQGSMAQVVIEERGEY